MKVEFENGYAIDFRMAVGSCFKSALANERFAPGDTIYDTSKAYSGSWSEALQQIGYGFQVANVIGNTVEYDVLRPSADRKSIQVVERVRSPVSTFIQKLQEGL